MNNEHNPIAQLITTIQQKWIDEVSPHDHLQLIRWLIRPDQARLYEGFLRLESTPNGGIPDVPIVLLTAFENKETHSQKLIQDWIETYKKDEKLQQDLKAKDLKFNWEVSEYEAKLQNKNTDYNLLLLEMLSTFQKAMPNPQLSLALSLYPYSIESTKEYAKWIDLMITLGLPDKVRLMFFDYVEERHFDELSKTHQGISKSLAVPIDLQGAINKIAAAGDPNDPEVQFRQCMIEMSKSVTKKNLPRLHNWGKKGLMVTQKSGSKSAFATAHVIYAGMLFNFKEYQIIEELLQKGMAIAKQGLSGGDDTCKPIIVQNYGYQASCKQLQKQKDIAADLFCKQAEMSIEYGFGPQALTAWWLGYNVIKKRDKKRYTNIVTEAYQYGVSLAPELIKSTCLAYIAADYYNSCEKNRNKEECESIDTFMKEIEGEQWRLTVETHRKEMEKKSLSILNWF
ncbi:hypothetical protein SAMN04487910_0047 [Aquimarina amphilecti]|uniref:Uncharacterized protein n=1 Tax=Aquimarina amphilecti TaxID=1038014 RepID=A0A1H7FCP0_AQUAM|nr:hypothetical protein [Aquimarina amphilecti]SEK23933.1 hypothetical protein SAMN04487910_0047 [Aquimarina amphilecti]